MNALNRKYGLVNGKIPLIGDVPVTFDDTIEDILDSYGEEPSGDESKDRDRCYDLMFYDWNSVVDAWSESVRGWYGQRNDKFGTDFPD